MPESFHFLIKKYLWQNISSVIKVTLKYCNIHKQPMSLTKEVSKFYSKFQINQNFFCSIHIL